MKKPPSSWLGGHHLVAGKDISIPQPHHARPAPGDDDVLLAILKPFPGGRLLDEHELFQTVGDQGFGGHGDSIGARWPQQLRLAGHPGEIPGRNCRGIDHRRPGSGEFRVRGQHQAHCLHGRLDWLGWIGG